MTKLVNRQSPLLIRKVKCPRHFILKPGRKPFKMEINPRLKQLPKWAFDKFEIPYERPVLDKNFNPVRDDTSFYQPLVSGAWAIEHVYDPESVDCKKCHGRCLEGLGKVNTYAIKRLRR